MRECFALLFHGCFVASVLAQDPTPTLIIPGEKHEDKSDSRKLASPSFPLAFNSLGLLRNDLTAYFAMDTTEMGGLTWSRSPIAVRASSAVEAREEDGRKYLDFSRKGARLSLSPPLPGSAKFTFTAWIKLPMPQKHGMVWDCDRGALLYFTQLGIQFWDRKTDKEGTWAKSTVPLSGWHHVAMAYDGKQTQAFLDATTLAKVDGIPASGLSSIGNSRSSQHEHWMMTSGIDEQIFFSRALTQEEIKTVLNFTKSGETKR